MNALADWHNLSGREKYLAYLQSWEWRAKCRLIRERDRDRCVHCHRSSYDDVSIQVHHRTYERLYREKPDDLETCCNICHAEIHGVPARGHPNHIAVIMKQAVEKMMAVEDA